MNVRGRLLVAIVVMAVVVGAGTAFERVLGARGLDPAPPPAASSGGWLCPHGGGEGHRAWVVAANPTERAAEVVVTSYSPEAAPPVHESLAPHTQRFFEVPAERLASASVLEFFGTPVVAGMVLLRGADEGVAAEPCAPQAARRWFVPEGTTVRGQAAALIAVNPFDQEAVLEVTLYTGADVIRHSNLRVVVEPRRSVAFQLNRFALGEESVLADVRVALGRVAVAGLGSGTEAGVRATLGVTDPAATWILPGAADSPPALVRVLGTDGQAAPFQVLAQDADGSKVVLEEEEVAPHDVESLEVPGEAAGIVVGEAGEVPFVAGRTLAPGEVPAPPPRPQQQGGGRGDGEGKGDRGRQEEEPAPAPDLAATAGAPRAAGVWVATSALPPGGGEGLLVLENPGGATATGDVTLMDGSGAVASPIPVTVEAGRTATIDLSEEVGTQPVAALVRLTTGKVVAAQVSTGPAGYAVAVAIPVEGATSGSVG